MSNETKVMNGYTDPSVYIHPGNLSASVTIRANKRHEDEACSLIIGDKAMPMGEVVKMLREMIGDSEQLTRAHRMVDVDDIKAIASKYGVDLTAHSA